MATIICPICLMDYPNHKLDCQNASYVEAVVRYVVKNIIKPVDTKI